MKPQQISFVKSHTLQDFMALHFASSSFNGRIMIGSRKSGSRSVYQVAAYPVDSMAEFLQHMKQVNQDYYITANAFSGICRDYVSLFSLHNIVIDIDCHGDVSEADRSHVIHHILQKYRDYAYTADVDVPNTIVQTGRGLQMWWAIQPVSAKCEWAYRATADKLAAQTNRFLQTDPYTSKYISRIDAAPTNNLAGYFRLPGSYNTRSHSYGSLEILHSNRLDIMAVVPMQNATKLKKPFRPNKPIDLDAARLAKNRLRQLSVLRDLRAMRSSGCGEQRDLYLFILYNSMCNAYSEEKVTSQLREFNNSFRNPLPDREIFRNLTTAKKKSGYALSNQWIIEQLQITEEEQSFINLYPAGSGHGSVREQEREEKRRAKSVRNEKILELYSSGETYGDIAAAVGCSKETVGRVVRASGQAVRSDQRREKIYHLYTDQGMSENEIAEELGITVKTVKRYLSTYQGNEAEPQKGALKEDGINSLAYKNFQVEKDVKTASIYLLYWGDRAISNIDGNFRKYLSDDMGAKTDDIDSDSGGGGSG